jgi:hypothetical protein
MNNSMLAQVATDSYRVDVNAVEGIATISFIGVIRLKELVDSFSDLVRHPNFVTDMACCYDCRDGIVEVNLNETEIFYHFAAGMRDKRGSRYLLAFVYGDEMTKVLVQFYRLFLARTEIDVEIFNDKKKAMAWLRDDYHIHRG